jgi:hypothetical protein
MACVGGVGLTTTGAIFVGAVGGFASGFAASLLNGGSIGDAFKAGAIGAVAGAATAGIGAKLGGARFGSSPGKWAAHKLAHGVVGGAVEEARGGEFRLCAGRC